MIFQLAILIIVLSLAAMWTDQMVAKELKNGNQEAFKQFFDSHYSSVIRYLRSRKCEAELAEDLVQNAFLYIWENRQQIDTEKSLKAYLFKIAHTRWLNTIKRDAKKESIEDHTPLSIVDQTEEEIQHNELQASLLSLLEKLPEKRQQVFRFCFLEEFTYKETAQIMGISVNTVENHMQKAFSDLRQGLQKYYPMHR